MLTEVGDTLLQPCCADAMFRQASIIIISPMSTRRGLRAARKSEGRFDGVRIAGLIEAVSGSIAFLREAEGGSSLGNEISGSENVDA